MRTELPSHPFLTENDGCSDTPYGSWKRPSTLLCIRGLTALLVLSCMVNVFQFARKDSFRERVVLQRSKYGTFAPKEGIFETDPDRLEADLAADLTLPFEWTTDYASTNLTFSGELWESINFDKGMVALPNGWTDSMQLPRAQAFPWDHEKGLYILNGFHVIHCLVRFARLFRPCQNYP